MSIKKSLRILLIISSMLPVMLVLVIAHGLLTDKLINSNTAKLAQTASISINGLESLIDGKKSEVALMSMNPELISVLKQNRYDADFDKSKAELTLRTLISNCSDHELLCLYNLNNEIIACSNSIYASSGDYLPDKTAFADAVGVMISSDGIKPVLINNHLLYKFDILAPVIDPDTDEILGYLISTVNTSCLKDCLENITVGESGFCFLLDNTGHYIYHPESELIGTTVDSEQLSSIVDSYKNGLTTENGSLLT